jgi:hypothetical protein
MLWYNNPESVKAIREGRIEGSTSERTRLMRLVRGDTVAAA